MSGKVCQDDEALLLYSLVRALRVGLAWRESSHWRARQKVHFCCRPLASEVLEQS